MRDWSIVTKIVASTCGIAFVLLLSGGLVLMRFETKLVQSFTDQYLDKIHQSIDKREKEEREALKKSFEFDTKILSGIAAIHLYNLDSGALKEFLRPLMSYKDILAIKILDEKEKPFAAAWRLPDIALGQELPKELNLDKSLKVQVDCIYEDKKIGSFSIFYTDSILAEKIMKLKEKASTEAKTFYSSSRVRLNQAILSQSIGLFLVLLILVFSLIFSLRALVLKPLRALSNLAHRLADFNLVTNVKEGIRSGDEIGKLFTAVNNMALSFRNVLGQVQRSGIQVTSSSTELAATAKEQEAIMTTQMESTNRVVKSVEEISDVATELVDTMQRVASMSQETAGFASSGQSDLARMEEAMRSMEDAPKSISGRLSAINEKAENITNVVTTITKVADQTNLLSLNAAIEAEKAGEYGRGFNVVAREIRRLADQTAVATLDIDQMVQEMQSAVSAGVMEMDKFIAEVKHSAEDVGKISAQLAKIIEQVQALSPSFEDVNVAMGHQSENAQKINAAMVNLSEEMQQTTDSLRETYAAIEQLNEAAKGLQDEVSRFKVS